MSAKAWEVSVWNRHRSIASSFGQRRACHAVESPATETACGLLRSVGMSVRHRLSALAAAAMLMATASTRALAAVDDEPEPATMKKEWVGLELTPVSYATSPPPNDYRYDGSFATWQGGPGGTIRLLQFRWKYAYVIPFMAGLYVTSGNRTIFAHTGAEGGVIVPGTDRRLELGVGLSVGVLAIRYGNFCDGSCVIGGNGPMATVAARVLLWNAPTFTAGISVRAFLPLMGSTEEGFGWYEGNSGIVMGAVEVGFGRP